MEIKKKMIVTTCYNAEIWKDNAQDILPAIRLYMIEKTWRVLMIDFVVKYYNYLQQIAK